MSNQVAVSLKDKSVNVVYAACEKGRTVLQKTSVLEVPITFNMIRRNDAGTADWNGAGIYGRDGKVQITAGACSLSDSTNLNP